MYLLYIPFVVVVVVAAVVVAFVFAGNSFAASPNWLTYRY